jgi:MYXO-CTERM domain-containing protein
MSSAAHATVLTPGSGVEPSSTVSALGTVLATQTLDGTSTTGKKTLSISVMEWVVQDKTTGDLDFVYQVTNLTKGNSFGLPASTTTVDHVSVSDFSALASANVGQNTTFAGGTTTSKYAPSNVQFDNAGNINWIFSTVIPAGSSSQYLIVATNAKYYENIGTVTGADGTTTAISPSFQPSPEPSTMALAGLGALGLIGYGVRRRRARTA